jgi:ABC-2 type transport system ATP-binding protein
MTVNPGGDAAYQVINVTKVYRQGKVRANDHINLEIQWGEIFGLLGPNGAGKTTLVKQLVGLLKPTEGTIRLAGHDILVKPGVIPNYVAYQSQSRLVLEDLTPEEAIYYTGRLRGLSSRAARQQTEAWLERLGLSSIRHRPTGQLSGGQQQLVQLGTTLVAERPVLVLDEPTSGLDPDHRKVVWDILLDLNRQRKATILLITHNVLEAELVVDRVGIIDHGKLLAIDSVGALKRQVDQRVRLEITTHPGCGDQMQTLLAIFGFVERLSENRLRLPLNPQQVPSVTVQMLREPMVNLVDDYRIVPPSLEDVYFQFGGKEKSIAD